MLTQKDLTLLSHFLATKVDLRQEVDRLDQKLSDRISNLSARLDGFMTREDGDRLYKLVDTVLGEVKAMREERALHTYRHDQAEERLDKIEATTFVSDVKE